MDTLILVALALNTAFALFQVAGPPGAIQVMECYKAILHVGSGSHFRCAADQNTYLAGAYFAEQLLFPHLGVGLMDESNLLRWYAPGNQLLADVLIDGKFRFRLRHGNSSF